MSEVSEIAKAHSEALVSKISEEIQATGPISFSRFMQFALYEPGLGYYAAGSHKLGRGGDFVTAPEISSLFSKCLANKCEEVLSQLKNGNILELGAGSGVMANDILSALTDKKALPEKYYILEVSADLKERQQNLLKKSHPDYFSSIIWLDKLPENFSGIILANEVIDAMPVDRFKVKGGKVLEIKVDLNQSYYFDSTPSFPRKRESSKKAINPFKEVLVEAPTKLNSAVQALNLPNDYESEINLNLPEWIKSLGNTLTEGEMVFIDYGFLEHEFYHPDRNRGTLMCHFQHKAIQDPYVNIGLQDITTHVNFTQLGDAGVDAGCKVLDYENQANFLMNYGLLELLESQTTAENQLDLLQQVKLLTMPSEMGELFKVMVLAK